MGNEALCDGGRIQRRHQVNCCVRKGRAQQARRGQCLAREHKHQVRPCGDQTVPNFQQQAAFADACAMQPDEPSLAPVGHVAREALIHPSVIFLSLAGASAQHARQEGRQKAGNRPVGMEGGGHVALSPASSESA